MITVSVLAVFLLLPIKMRITNQQDQVFQLFTTISREKLEGIQIGMIKNEDYFAPIKEKLKILHSNDQLFKTRKKKSIGQINRLKKITQFQILVALSMIALLMIYPIVNYIITQKFLSDQNKNSKMINLYSVTRNYNLLPPI